MWLLLFLYAKSWTFKGKKNNPNINMLRVAVSL